MSSNLQQEGEQIMKRELNPWLSRVLLIVLIFGLVACSKAPSDDSIGSSLKASFYSDPQLKNEYVEITVKDGEVTLAGSVSSDTVRLQAYKLADGTPGVRKVNDQMQVGPAEVGQGGPPAQPASSDSGKTKGSMTGSSAPAAGGTPSSSSAPTAPPVPAARKVTIPAGTSVRVQMIDSVNSKKNKVGETFAASLADPITVGNEVAVPKGADIFVRLTEAKSAGKIKGKSELQLSLDHLEFHGKTYALSSSTYKAEGGSRGKQTAKRVGIGAGIGTAIGAIAGGGKGAAIGAAVGAGSGAAVQVLTQGEQVQVPSETKLDFQLGAPVEILVAPAGKK
jgi:hypothetical protein